MRKLCNKYGYKLYPIACLHLIVSYTVIFGLLYPLIPNHAADIAILTSIIPSLYIVFYVDIMYQSGNKSTTKHSQ